MHQIDLHRISMVTIKAYKKSFEGDSKKKGFHIINELAKNAKTSNSSFIVMIFPLFLKLKDYPFIDIHEKIKSFCEDKDIPVLDLYPYFKEKETKKLWAAPTDHHPNEIAHNITSEALFEFLKKTEVI